MPGARIEFWVAGPGGDYDDVHRATIVAREDGSYRFESNFPPPEGGTPPHIHARVTASGFRELVTKQHPQPGELEARLDLVVVPSDG